MCGIIGYIGTENATPILINGLKRLEYRGYDSVGIALPAKDEIATYKVKGRISALEQETAGKTLWATSGIGHTRWATHGSPEKKNAHPHLSNDGKVAVVHNGIIENYGELKNFLTDKGFAFFSDTDTEVIPNLISYFYKDDLLSAILQTAALLKGSFALGIMIQDKPDVMVALKKDSPLIVGLGKGENFIASDIPAILEHTRNVLFLEDGDCAILKKDKVEVFDLQGKRLQRKIQRVDFDISAAEKGGYDHFMLKEIYEQPLAVRNTLTGRIHQGKPVSIEGLDGNEIKNIDKIYIVACGTAYHAGLTGKKIIESLVKIPVEVDIASEFRYRDPIIDSSCLTIVISQSGETADTLAALRLAKEKGSTALAITNVVGSTVSRESDLVIYTNAGPEIAVASTKAYTTQLAALYILALFWAEKRNTLPREETDSYKEELTHIPSLMESILNDHTVIRNFCNDIKDATDVFYLGRGGDTPLAMEGALKLKEISYIHAEAYPSGELKHGPMALIEKGTPVIFLSTQTTLQQKTESNIREVISRGAYTFGIIKEGFKADFCDDYYKIPTTDDLFSPLLTAITMQLIAYYTASIKGIDLDKPRNLAKSVTVE